MMKQFQITYTVGVTLNEEELWPDDDAPKNPTTADVRKLIQKSGGIYRVLDDWNLRESEVCKVTEAQP